MKQDLLATIMGNDWNQMKISCLDGKKEIEDVILDEVARTLKIPVEAIKKFDEEAVISIVANTVNKHDNATGNSLFSYILLSIRLTKLLRYWSRRIKERMKILPR
ncbi:XRE family transcriptional regulator [[Flexibacter] sp. ATCC 35208]|uniref:XRE family transcriptional regulator n=1 Tax=[Flexibacter] sp. ATCC 35208 TaxID=1936242 RepID=UPI0009D4D3C6|nr:XRE family transcriptional regulator [[Flexibacter] sp. ATCC 35208]OMP74548.1 hypothetical protein BW716_34770 [[Flexibacter] sp. ATCC 35208]